MMLREKRYAEALMEIAQSRNIVDELQADLGTVDKIYSDNAELRDFLTAPEIPGTVKKNVLINILNKNVRPEILNLAQLLIDKKSVNLVPGILREYTKLAEKKRNTLVVEISSSQPLSDQQLRRLSEKYREKYNASSVRTVFSIDEKAMGGVRVKIGDQVYDGTLMARLNELHSLLVK